MVSKTLALLTCLLWSCVTLAATPMKTWHEVAYGPDPQQRFDVYAPKDAKAAPVIFMVHGGAWTVGDKAAGRVVSGKVAHWVPKGYVVVSTNYRMLPKATPLEQADDVAKALSVAQARAASWGADRSRFILMGHSAGAHLVALISASPSFTERLGVTPWLGSVLLDSAALDVVQIMESRHLRFYDRAFGKQYRAWPLASPFHVMSQAPAPILAVCSSQRADSCPQAERFVDKALSLGAQASVLTQNLSHMDLNQTLGKEGPYTEAVDAFLQQLTEQGAASDSPAQRPAKSGG